MVVLDTYYNLILSKFQPSGLVPERLTDATDVVGKMSHLLWMIENMPEEGTAKWSRWLGFIQGTLAAFNLRSIDEMREDNR